MNCAIFLVCRAIELYIKGPTTWKVCRRTLGGMTDSSTLIVWAVPICFWDENDLHKYIFREVESQRDLQARSCRTVQTWCRTCDTERCRQHRHRCKSWYSRLISSINLSTPGLVKQSSVEWSDWWQVALPNTKAGILFIDRGVSNNRIWQGFSISTVRYATYFARCLNFSFRDRTITRWCSRLQISWR